MRVLVFGATGGSGRCIVRDALARGHEVTAFVRSPAKLDVRSPRLRVVRGDVRDDASVGAVMPGHDGVLCALGVYARGYTTVLSDATRVILRAMEFHRVKRLVCESSLGVGDGRRRTGFVFSKIVLPLFLHEAFLDKDRQETAVRESAVDWVIVRPGELTNGPRTGRFRAADDGSIAGAVKISRADVAGFMLDQLTNDRWLRRAPELAY